MYSKIHHISYFFWCIFIAISCSKSTQYPTISEDDAQSCRIKTMSLFQGIPVREEKYSYDYDSLKNLKKITYYLNSEMFPTYYIQKGNMLFRSSTDTVSSNSKDTLFLNNANRRYKTGIVRWSRKGGQMNKRII